MASETKQCTACWFYLQGQECKYNKQTMVDRRNNLHKTRHHIRKEASKTLASKEVQEYYRVAESN